jgi:hypothetical protein
LRIVTTTEENGRERNDSFLAVFRFRKRHRPFLEIHHLPSHPGKLSPSHGRFQGEADHLTHFFGGVFEELFPFSRLKSPIPASRRGRHPDGLDRIRETFHSPFLPGNLKEVGNDCKIEPYRIGGEDPDFIRWLSG